MHSKKKRYLSQDPYTLSAKEAETISQEELLKKLQSSEKGLSSKEAEERLAICGSNALKEKKRNVLLQFLKYFWGPIPWMIEIAAILSIVAYDFNDFIIIMVLLLFNTCIGFFEEYKAGNALEALKKHLALRSHVLRDEAWAELDAVHIVPGDVIRVRLGDVIPADAKLFSEGYLSVDQSVLTGESLPVDKKPGELIYSGSIAKQGEMMAIVTATGANTFFGKTAKLVSEAGNISHFQQAVLRVGNFLILLAAALCLLLVIVVLYRDYTQTGTVTLANGLDLAKFVLILAVASIPVAMPAVLSITMALGALAMSRKQAIVSRLQSIEEMAGVDILCSDKTGTLTQNKLTLGDPVLFVAKDAQECILGGALASKEENGDVIDLTIINGLKDKAVLKKYKQLQFTPFDPVHKRTQVTVVEPNGKTILFTKGAPQVIAELCQLQSQEKEKAGQSVDALAQHGYRSLGVATSNDDGKSWALLGIIPLFDPPRTDSASTIIKAKEHGVHIKMLTGDDIAIAMEISTKLDLGTNIHKATDLFQKEAIDPITDAMVENIEKADGFARVFPEHKYWIVKALQKKGHLVGMTGDGVNDAPALRQADVGIAVSGATDAARAAASLILTAPGLSVIITAIETARKIFERMLSYTIYRIAMTIDIMFFVVIAMLLYPQLPHTTILFKPLTAIMIIFLALLDDIPIMAIAYDHTNADENPVRWQMGRVMSTSSVLGIIAMIETLSLLFIGMNYVGKPFFGTIITGVHLQTMMFLQLVIGGHLMLFVTRTKSWFFLRPWPSPILFWAIIFTQIVAALLCGFGWNNVIPRISWELIGFIWAYNIGWMFLQDIAKRMTHRLLDYKAKHFANFKALLSRKLHPHMFHSHRK